MFVYPAHVLTHGSRTSLTWLICRQSDVACEFKKEALSKCQDGVEEVVLQGGMGKVFRA